MNNENYTGPAPEPTPPQGGWEIGVSLTERALDTAILGLAAVAIDYTELDAWAQGYGADVVGTAAGASFLSMLYQRQDLQFLPAGAALAVTGIGEWSQRIHYFEGYAVLGGLDGVYDVRDFAAYGAGAALYLGIQKGKQLLRANRRRKN